jgi:hypothetical protein
MELSLTQLRIHIVDTALRSICSVEEPSRGVCQRYSPRLHAIRPISLLHCPGENLVSLDHSMDETPRTELNIGLSPVLPQTIICARGPRNGVDADVDSWRSLERHVCENPSPYSIHSPERRRDAGLTVPRRTLIIDC